MTLEPVHNRSAKEDDEVERKPINQTEDSFNYTSDDDQTCSTLTEPLAQIPYTLNNDLLLLQQIQLENRQSNLQVPKSSTGKWEELWNHTVEDGDTRDRATLLADEKKEDQCRCKRLNSNHCKHANMDFYSNMQYKYHPEIMYNPYDVRNSNVPGKNQGIPDGISRVGSWVQRFQNMYKTFHNRSNISNTKAIIVDNNHNTIMCRRSLETKAIQTEPTKKADTEDEEDNADCKELLKNEVSTISEKEKKEKNPQLEKKPEQLNKTSLENKVDIYYFDHGNAAYYNTTDQQRGSSTQHLIERTDFYATRFWAEIFGTINVGFAFVIAFILQLYRFILSGLIRPMLVGVLQLLSDYTFKPLLAIVFNGFCQPIMILGYNITTSLRDLCEPVAQMCGFFLKEWAQLIRAFRLVEIKTEKSNTDNRLV